jgi:hypothetical protein
MVTNLVWAPKWRRNSVLSLPNVGSSSKLDALADDSSSSRSGGYKRWRNERVAAYCSRECQQQHLAEAHRKEWKRLQERRDQAVGGGAAAAAAGDGELRDLPVSTSAAVAETVGGYENPPCAELPIAGAAAGDHEVMDVLGCNSVAVTEHAAGDYSLPSGELAARGAAGDEEVMDFPVFTSVAVGGEHSLSSKQSATAAAAATGGCLGLDLPVSTSAAVAAAVGGDYSL